MLDADFMDNGNTFQSAGAAPQKRGLHYASTETAGRL